MECKLRSWLLSFGKQVPHRAFGPVRNDKALEPVRNDKEIGPVRNDKAKCFAAIIQLESTKKDG